MNNTAAEVLAFVQDSDIQFIRLGFCDIFGQHKNISIMADALRAAFVDGVSFDAHSVPGFSDVTHSDLLLFPDPATLRVLPWRPGPGSVVRFYCDIKNPDGSDFKNDTRSLLKRLTAEYEKAGYATLIGTECEFYLFKTDEDGEPTLITLDRGGYLDISPLDKGEDIRREICLTLEQMGITPETSHHENGPGQNEVDFRFSDALSSADNMLTFKSVVKSIAARNGLFASFMPKPIANAPGNGLHINISLAKDSHNIFSNDANRHSVEAESFIAGILNRIVEITLFLNPIANSYERFGYFEAPRHVSWSHQNRSQLIRIPAARGEKVRMELRSPDAALNPYLAYSLILAAGMEGIENQLALPAELDVDLYAIDDMQAARLTSLPADLFEAIAAAEASNFVPSVLGDDLSERYLAAKRREAFDYQEADDRQLFNRQRYFEII